jgi:hypothetical protein
MGFRMRRHRLSRLALVCSLAIVLVLPVFAESTKIRVDGSAIKGYVTYLASDASQGRRTLTPGYEKAAEWAAAKFKEWGLKPAGENGTYFQRVPITSARSAYVWSAGVPSLVLNGRTFYHREGSFAVDPASTPGAKVAGGVVFVGYGISAPSKGLDEYAGVDVKGKVVLVLKGSPTTAPSPRVMFAPAPAPEAPRPAGAKDEWAEETTDKAKVMTAYGRGAAAVMLYSPDPSPGAGMRADIKGKKTRSSATGVTAALTGYDTVTRYGEQYKNNVGRNVIAKIDGTDPTLKAQYVIAGGHLDHVGITNGVIFNGADDNASGAATTMEVARALAAGKVQPKRTLIFALWTGEEQGLIGSQHYSDNPTDGVKMDATVAYFNMDMVGLGDRIGAPGALNFPSIFDVIMRDQDPEIAKRFDASQSGPGGSDHSAFNFERVDVPGPDGVWFGDKVTPAGKEALAAMQANAIALNLVRPTAALLGDALASAKTPIMVTGVPAMDAALLDTFKKNNALAVLECDPADVDGCVRQMTVLSGVVGKTNLLVSVGAHKDRAAATQKLFLAAVKAGWTKDELFAAAGQAAGRGGPGGAGPNNLSRFGGAPAGRPF